MIFTGFAGYCWAESGAEATSAAVAARVQQSAERMNMLKRYADGV
jgi:hypothetical protein